MTTYTIIRHEDLGDDRSVVGRLLGSKGGFADIESAADHVEELGAPDVARWLRRDKDWVELFKCSNPFYCGAGSVDGTYTRFDIQEDD